MSRAWHALMALAMVTPHHVSAQDAAAWHDSVVGLSAQVRALRDSLRVGDSTAREVTRRDGIVIAASPYLRDRAAGAFDGFMIVRSRWFGASQPSPNGFRIVIRTLDQGGFVQRFGGWNRLSEGRVVVSGVTGHQDTAQTTLSTNDRNLGPVILQAYGELMFRALPEHLQVWLTNPPPVHLDDPERRYLAMYGVMTSTGRAERGCIAGRLEFCRYALGLRAAPSSELSGAYAPLVRADLLFTALEMGGPLAWARFAGTASGRAEEALAAAAGQPADSVVAKWRTGIVALKPDKPVLGSGAVLLAAAWISVVLLGTLGAARWR